MRNKDMTKDEAAEKASEIMAAFKESKGIFILKKDNLEGEFGQKIEEILNMNSELIEKFKSTSPLYGKLKGLFTTMTYIREIKGSGAILHYEHLIHPNTYCSDIYLLGFSGEDKLYLTLKSQLEDIAEESMRNYLGAD